LPLTSFKTFSAKRFETIFSSELLQLVEDTLYSLIQYTLAACRAHIRFEWFINTIDTCRASESYWLIWHVIILEHFLQWCTVFRSLIHEFLQLAQFTLRNRS